jgi:hypothetical protein
MVASEHHIHVRELVIHGVAYGIAAGIAAIILYRNYWFIEAYTGDASEARDAFLTCVAVAGGFGPAVTSLFLWLRGIGRRSGERQPSPKQPPRGRKD